MTFSAYLQQRARRIDQRLFELLENWKKQYVALNDLVPLLNAFIESCKGGKRLRAALVVLGYELGKKGSNHDILQPAIAFKFFKQLFWLMMILLTKVRFVAASLPYILRLVEMIMESRRQYRLGTWGFFLQHSLLRKATFLLRIKIEHLVYFQKRFSKQL